jgi:ABC-type antimicrobial peptide transport system permease subunit
VGWCDKMNRASGRARRRSVAAASGYTCSMYWASSRSLGARFCPRKMIQLKILVFAPILAAVGICGVTAYNTRQRTHEIGIRLELGASKDDILWLILGHERRLTFVGMSLSLAASFALTRYLSSLLLGVTSTDALTFFIVGILLCAVALFASFIPARRAMRVDPMVALHYE